MFEKAICNINNYKDAPISPGAIATVYAHNQQINPIEKVVELYERLLKSEQEKNRDSKRVHKAGKIINRLEYGNGKVHKYNSSGKKN